MQHIGTRWLTIMAVAAGMAVGVGGAPRAARAEAATSADTPRARCEGDPRVQLGLVPLETCVGAELFFREPFGGNGRTCGSCHPAQNNYTIDPAYIATLPGDDALFVAEQSPELAQLEQPELLRRHGLILVNADGPSDPTHNFVMRSVSHMLAIATSTTPPRLEEGSTIHATDGTLLPPLERLGWAGDGAPGRGELRDFADGAITQHLTRSLARQPGVDFRLPSDPERDAIAAFSRSIGRTAELELEHVQLSDGGAERGRKTFLEGTGLECSARCHVNAGANSLTRNALGEAIGGLENSTFDIGTALVRVPSLDDLGIPLDGGFGLGPHLDLDGDGALDSFGNGGMNVPPLIEAPDTAPYFHTHAFGTLEEAIRFYASEDFAHSFVASTIDFENRAIGEAMPLSDGDIADLGRFLRVLNTSLNCQMASYRLRAALAVADQGRDPGRRVQLGLAGLARAEIDDALEVLGAVKYLHPETRALLEAAKRHIGRAGAPYAARPSWELRRALALVAGAERSLGSGLEMPLGPGTLMF